jgi:hypothetical protein
MTQNTRDILKLIGPFFIILGLIFTYLNYDIYKSGVMHTGPKFGPKVTIERSKDPERFNNELTLSVLLTFPGLFVGIGISIYAYKSNKSSNQSLKGSGQ